MIHVPRGLPDNVQPVAPSTSGTVCYQVQQQAATICLTSSGPTGLGSGCPQSVLGESGPICLPTSCCLWQSGGEVAGLPMQQNHSDSPRVAKHALVLVPGGHVQSDPTVPAPTAKVTD